LILRCVRPEGGRERRPEPMGSMPHTWWLLSGGHP
jgi:hypothetical protein